MAQEDDVVGAQLLEHLQAEGPDLVRRLGPLAVEGGEDVAQGAAAVDVPLSRWFLAFGVFVFLSLALLKRFVETKTVAESNGGPLAGRGYRLEDQAPLLSLGTAAGAVSALVYCLYITGEEAQRLYARPDVLWLGLPVILYWLARVWILANRGEVHDDPIVFALKDPVSYAVLAAFLATVVGAT